MIQNMVRVLFLGASAQGFSILANRLSEHRCECSSVSSIEEACALFRKQPFDLVLGEVPIHQADYFLDMLIRPHASFYYCHPVKTSCWWIPVVRNGEKMQGAHAQRPGVSAKNLDYLFSSGTSVVAPNNLQTGPAA